MGKFFNIAGPCNPERHYMQPATARVPEVMRLIEDETYFVVHARRQCGKTAAFRELGKPWDEKIGQEKIDWKGRAIHLIRC